MKNRLAVRVALQRKSITAYASFFGNVIALNRYIP